MHGIPVKSEGHKKYSNHVRSSSQEDAQYTNPATNVHSRKKGNRKHKTDVVEQHV